MSQIVNETAQTIKRRIPREATIRERAVPSSRQIVEPRQPVAPRQAAAIDQPHRGKR